MLQSKTNAPLHLQKGIEIHMKNRLAENDGDLVYVRKIGSLDIAAVELCAARP